jgi:hypothetical protein
MKKVFSTFAGFTFLFNNKNPSTKMETKQQPQAEPQQTIQPQAEELVKQQEIGTTPEEKAEAIAPHAPDDAKTLSEVVQDALNHSDGEQMPDLTKGGLVSDSVVQEEPQTNRQLTFGERLVGLNFNPSQDPKVKRAKELCAELADLVNGHFVDEPLTDDVKLKHKLFDHVINQILVAQMSVVKVLTF